MNINSTMKNRTAYNVDGRKWGSVKPKWQTIGSVQFYIFHAMNAQLEIFSPADHNCLMKSCTKLHLLIVLLICAIPLNF